MMVLLDLTNTANTTITHCLSSLVSIPDFGFIMSPFQKETDVSITNMCEHPTFDLDLATNTPTN
jgi:hypothetical protein